MAQPIFIREDLGKENNPEKIQRKVNFPLVFGGSAILHFIALAGLSAVVSRQGYLDGLLVGFLISLIWALPSLGGTYLFANRSLKLLAVDAGMYIVLFSLSGLILGIW